MSPALVLRLALVLLSVLAIWRFGEVREEAGRAEVKAAWLAERATQAQALAAAQQLARDIEADINRRIKEATNAYIAESEASRRAAGRARTELDRLRDAIAAAPTCALPSDTGAPARPELAASSAGQLLGECAAAHQELAAEADALADRLRAVIAAWPPKPLKD